MSRVSNLEAEIQAVLQEGSVVVAGENGEQLQIHEEYVRPRLSEILNRSTRQLYDRLGLLRRMGGDATATMFAPSVELIRDIMDNDGTNNSDIVEHRSEKNRRKQGVRARLPGMEQELEPDLDEVAINAEPGELGETARNDNVTVSCVQNQQPVPAAEGPPRDRPAVEGPRPSSDRPAVEIPRPSSDRPAVEIPRPSSDRPAVETHRPSSDRLAVETPRPSRDGHVAEGPPRDQLALETPRPSSDRRPASEGPRPARIRSAVDLGPPRDLPIVEGPSRPAVEGPILSRRDRSRLAHARAIAEASSSSISPRVRPIQKLRIDADILKQLRGIHLNSIIDIEPQKRGFFQRARRFLGRIVGCKCTRRVYE